MKILDTGEDEGKLELMELRDLKNFAELGRALWVDPGRSASVMAETLSAVTLQELQADQALERACAVLLERARGQGMAAQTRDLLATEGGFNQPFFRLGPDERFALAALHLGRWSYRRLSRVMGFTPEQVEEIAWSARVQLAASASGLAPLGGKVGAHCPQYESHRPWTQRFLDEEIRLGADRIFLQNHLMACDSCMQALNRCRDLYYSVERILPKVEGSDDAVVLELREIHRQGLRLLAWNRDTLARSLVAFARQRDVQVFFALAAFGMILWLLHRGG